MTQRVLPTGPWFAAQRSGDFDVGLAGNCQGIVNPLLDVHAYLPHSVNKANFGYYEDPELLEIHEKALHSTDPKEQKELMYQFAKRVMGDGGACRVSAVVVSARAAALVCAWLDNRTAAII